MSFSILTPEQRVERRSARAFVICDSPYFVATFPPRVGTTLRCPNRAKFVLVSYDPEAALRTDEVHGYACGIHAATFRRRCVGREMPDGWEFIQFDGVEL